MVGRPRSIKSLAFSSGSSHPPRRHWIHQFDRRPLPALSLPKGCTTGLPHTGVSNALFGLSTCLPRSIIHPSATPAGRFLSGNRMARHLEWVHLTGGILRHFRAFFYTQTESCSRSFIYARPPASNANRWAVYLTLEP